jgi:hypothetical protein
VEQFRLSERYRAACGLGTMKNVASQFANQIALEDPVISVADVRVTNVFGCRTHERNSYIVFFFVLLRGDPLLSWILPRIARQNQG